LIFGHEHPEVADDLEAKIREKNRAGGGATVGGADEEAEE